MTPYYADETVTLFLGDMREVTDWLAADVLVTDPPYGVGAALWSDNAPCIAGEPRQNRASDREIGPEAVAVRNSALQMWGDRPALVFGSWRAPRPPRTRMRLIWDRVHIGMGGIGPWHPTDEEIYVIGTGWPLVGSESTIIRHPRTHIVGRRHPHEKPVGLLERALEWCPAGIIADPFAGSGPTLVAARNLGRKAIGVEINEAYCERIARRLDQGVLDLGGAA